MCYGHRGELGGEVLRPLVLVPVAVDGGPLLCVLLAAPGVEVSGLVGRPPARRPGQEVPVGTDVVGPTHGPGGWGRSTETPRVGLCYPRGVVHSRHCGRWFSLRRHHEDDLWKTYISVVSTAKT